MRNVLIVPREMNKWSVAKVASELGITSDEYQKLESGEGRITIKIAQDLGELYNIAPEYFLSNESKVINYNTGTFSKGIIHAVTFLEGKEDKLASDEMNNLLKEQKKQIEALQDELVRLRKK